MCKCFNYKFSSKSIFVECTVPTVMLVIEFKMLMWEFKFQSGSNIVHAVNVGSVIEAGRGETIDIESADECGGFSASQ